MVTRINKNSLMFKRKTMLSKLPEKHGVKFEDIDSNFYERSYYYVCSWLLETGKVWELEDKRFGESKHSEIESRYLNILKDFYNKDKSFCVQNQQEVKDGRFKAVKEHTKVFVDPSLDFSLNYNGKKLEIMGNEWTIVVLDPDSPEFKYNSDTTTNGYLEAFTREIILRDLTKVNSPYVYDNIIKMMYRALRHEIVHAFFLTIGCLNYYEDERLTDNLACLLPNMFDVINDVGAM